MKDFNLDKMSDEELKKALDESSFPEEEKVNIDDDESSSIIEMKDIEDTKELSREEKRQRQAELKVQRKNDRELLKQRKKNRKEAIKNNIEIKRVEAPYDKGLTNEEFEERMSLNLCNRTKKKTSKSLGKIFVSNICTFFNFLIFFLAALLIFVNAYLDLTFLLIAVCNIIIGIIQEIRAKNMIDKLSLMTSPTASVVRDSEEHEISTADIVIDDIIVLRSGNQIPADSIVVEGDVEVNESLLTGESEPIVKHPGDNLLSGSFVASGTCYARVEHVGQDNYIEKLSNQAKAYKKPKSDLLGSLNLIIKVMTVPVIVLGTLLFIIMYFRQDQTFTYSVRKMCGAVIGMIPSGLFLMASIALTVGVLNLGQKNVLVQELYCIEMLARVNCICLDKTGTITDGTMKVRNEINYNKEYELKTGDIISALLNATKDNNFTSKALKSRYGNEFTLKETGVIVFNSKIKYEAASFEKYGTFILGAPEFVLQDGYKKYQKEIERYAKLGYRVLSLVRMDGDIVDNNTLPNSKMELLSLILIEDNIRPDARKTIEYFIESGVEVKVISGDNPVTVSKIAERAGVLNYDKYVSLDGMTDNEVILSAARYNVFGRVTPHQKKLLVQTLKKMGKTVAMTGDGINDILALKEADCSIAMASGSDAARNCSHLVLVDSNFDSMPYVVAEGRRVINNITKVSALFLTKTFFSLFLAIQGLMTGVYPLSANQFFMIDLFCIGLPSLFLVMEPNNSPFKGKFIVNVMKEALPGAFTVLIISIIVFALTKSLYFDDVTRTTIIVISATHTCMMVLFKICKPWNKLHRILVTVCYTLFLICIFLIPKLFELRPLTSYSEYYSSDAKIVSIKNYPSINISDDYTYVMDGKIVYYYPKNVDGTYSSNAVSLKVDNNNTTDTLTANYMNSSTSNTLFYAINGKITNVKLDLPDLSFDENGLIYVSGYKIDNFNYEENFEDNLYLDSAGHMYYKNQRNYVKISLTRENSYYGYYTPYGKETSGNSHIKTYSLMPTIEIKGSNYIINGDNSQEYKYKVPDKFINDALKSDIEPEIKAHKDPETGDNMQGVYELWINGVQVKRTYNDQSREDEEYLIVIPKISKALSESGTDRMYIEAKETGLNIAELFGEKVSLPGNVIGYNFYDSSDNLLTYNKNEKQFYNGEELLDAFAFANFPTNNYASYRSTTDTVFTAEKVELSVGKYDGTTLVENDKFSVNTGDRLNSIVTSCSLDDKFYGPEIKHTTKDHYIIDDYYTDYSANENYIDNLLNLRSDVTADDYYLVIGNLKTNYKFDQNAVVVTKGGTIRELSISSKIFVLMLCLLASPLIKLFTNLIPWIVKGFKSLREYLIKINPTIGGK